MHTWEGRWRSWCSHAASAILRFHPYSPCPQQQLTYCCAKSMCILGQFLSRILLSRILQTTFSRIKWAIVDEELYGQICKIPFKNPASFHVFVHVPDLSFTWVCVKGFPTLSIVGISLINTQACKSKWRLACILWDLGSSQIRIIVLSGENWKLGTKSANLTNLTIAIMSSTGLLKKKKKKLKYFIIYNQLSQIL